MQNREWAEMFINSRERMFDCERDQAGGGMFNNSGTGNGKPMYSFS